MIRIDFNKLRFLVIDDNAHMRRILRTLLHGFGAREVYEAEDGAAGLEAFTHYMPDIVLADWEMPIFNGLELAQMLRQPSANTNPYAPIIMLTAHSEKKRVIDARDAGITEFMAKPISAKALYQRILHVVANPRPFVRTKTYFGPTMSVPNDPRGAVSRRPRHQGPGGDLQLSVGGGACRQPVPADRPHPRHDPHPADADRSARRCRARNRSRKRPARHRHRRRSAGPEAARGDRRIPGAREPRAPGLPRRHSRAAPGTGRAVLIL